MTCFLEVILILKLEKKVFWKIGTMKIETPLIYQAHMP